MTANRPRLLRRHATEAENHLWRAIRDRQLAGFKFRRQHRLGHYIVDFVCHEKRLVIEIDGGQHALAAVSEEHRQSWLEAEGFRVLRFWNHEVLANLDGVLVRIAQSLRS